MKSHVFDPHPRPADFDPWRACLSGEPILTESPPPAPLMQFGAHRGMEPRLLQEKFLESRCGWLVRLCNLGQGWCIGVITESDAADLESETRILYAVITGLDRQRVELELGKGLDQIFADGIAVEILARAAPLRSLLWVSALPLTKGYSIRAASHNDDGLRRAHEQKQARADFHARRENALALRKTGNENPAWIPAWCADALRAATAQPPPPKRTFSNDC